MELTSKHYCCSGLCYSAANHAYRSALRISTKDVQNLLEQEGLSVKDEDIAVYRAVFDGVDTCAEEIMAMEGMPLMVSMRTYLISSRLCPTARS